MTFSDSLKKLILPEKGKRIANSNVALKISTEDFISPTEKEIISLMTPAFLKGMQIVDEVNNSFQTSFFLYERSNIETLKLSI